MKSGFVYIITNRNNTVLYTGVTSHLVRRVHLHKEKRVEGLSKKYICHKLVYYECGDDIEACIAREKQIKAGSRKKKVQLIESVNPDWRDLYPDII
jgi:putative endonuclease